MGRDAHRGRRHGGEPRARRDTGERQGPTPGGGLRDGRTRHDQHDEAISARPRHQRDAVEGAETQRSRAGREGPQPQSQNGEFDPRYKKILDQLNKQQQQRARGWPFGSAASACVTTKGTRSRRSWWCRRPRPHVAWGVVKDGTNHRGHGHIRRAHEGSVMCVESKNTAYII